MNVMKRDFALKRNKLRPSNHKFAKPKYFSYQTVSSRLPYSRSSFEGSRGNPSANTSEASGLVNATFSKSDTLVLQESTSGGMLFKTFETSVSRELIEENEDPYEDERETRFFQSHGQSQAMGTNDGTASDTEMEQLMRSFHVMTDTSSSEDDDEFMQTTIPDKLSTSTSAGVYGSSEVDAITSSFIGRKENDSSDEDMDGTFIQKFRSETSSSSSVPIRCETNPTRTPLTCQPKLRYTTLSSGNKRRVNSRSCPSSGGRTPGSKSFKSPKATTTSNDSDTGSYILAVTEGRGHARGEVGIAAMDPRRPHLILCQISDTQRYVHSLTKMNVFNFTEIIIPNTFIEGPSPSKLYADLRDNFPLMIITSVQRRHFNEANGLDFFKQYGSPESASVMVILRDKFYALSAASALVKYIEFTQNVLFAPRSVKIEYQGTEDTMIIDLNTANRLELVTSRINRDSTANNTLMGVLNHCHTRGGARLLRANILQPPCRLDKIEMRLDCVSELVKKPLLAFALESAVTKFTSVENLLSLCMHAPQQDGLRSAEYQLRYVLLLKTTLNMLPNLVASLESAESKYLCRVRQSLNDERFKLILDRILEALPESTKIVKGAVAAHLNGCFSIRTGINGLLDVAKKTYCEIVQEIWDHVNSLQEKYDLPLKMSFSRKRGFHIQCTPRPSQKNVKISDLPKEFILVQRVKSTFYFYTTEVVALDQRSQQVLNEVKLISNVIICELLNDVRPYVGCLFNLCEYIAELDLIVSFAHIGSGQGYVRPKFGDILDVSGSRHPILDVIHEGKIVPNDIFAEKEKNFTILTGPNQSGKSIYIGQVALLQIMAQIGCYVPAESASFRIADRLFSRLGFDDCIEFNASTLINEMRDIDYLRTNISCNSLVIIDELCRGTSVQEGTALAFTICEEFLDYTAFIFVTTHYLFITKLEEMYCNVVNYHFDSELVEVNDGQHSLRFSHKRLPGVTKAEQYGLRIAELTCFPSNILSKAKEIARQLQLERKPLPEVSGLVAGYKLSREFKELSPGKSDRDSIRQRYKSLCAQLNPVLVHDMFDSDNDNDNGPSQNPSECPTEKFSPGHTTNSSLKEHEERARVLIPPVVCRKIKNKYRRLTTRRASFLKRKCVKYNKS